MWIIRRRLAAAVALTLVAGAIVVAVLRWASPAGSVTVHGPYGAFPAPLGRQVSLHPSHLLYSTHLSATVDQGLAVAWGDEQLSAVNLRTGRTYWRYDRKGQFAIAVAVDHASGDLFVVWSPDNGSRDSRPARIDRVNVRTGRTRWTAEVPDGIKVNDGWPDSGPWLLLGVPDRVIVLGKNGMVEYTADHGDNRWETESCGDAVTAGLATPAMVVVAFDQCGSAPSLAGYDPADGTRRWQRPIPTGAHVPYLATLGGGLAQAEQRRPDVLGIFDVGTGATTATRTASGFGNITTRPGLRLQRCDVTGHSEGVRAVCAVDPVSGRPLWTVPLPGKYLASADPMTTHGTDDPVYVPADDNNQHPNSTLFELDRHTGTVLSQTALPHIATVTTVQQADSGVLVLYNNWTNTTYFTT